MTEYLQNELNQKGYQISRREWASSIKEKLCYVAEDFEDEMVKAAENAISTKTFELPDGNQITIDTEQFKCTEILFQPYLIEKDVDGIHELIFESISKCKHESFQSDFFGGIVLSGGNTMFNGMGQRIKKELQNLSNYCKEIQVVEPKIFASAWVGGSIFASLSTFEEICITSDEYEENGPGVVHKKCVV